ncbi:hypothetical protein JA9_004228 [Meyerozyma sp. JA9]|nr:hypothetical protein JA9_004228 [Meyerozyma sp. JA9]
MPGASSTTVAQMKSEASMAEDTAPENTPRAIPSIPDSESSARLAPLHPIRKEVETISSFHPSISALTQSFVRYLREPRFQAPLSLDELKVLFSSFYDDLNGLAINVYTQSNSCKKRLIARSDHFNAHPHHYDYLLAIANYSSSSIKLSKRTDDESLMQLRVFNYYKFLTVTKALECAHTELFSASTSPDGSSLHEKLQRFDHHDIVFQEFLDDKLEAMKDIPFEAFSEGDRYPLVDKQEEIHELSRLLASVKDKFTPREKLNVVVSLQQRLITLLSESSAGKTSDVSADHLLPVLIHFLVRHGSGCDLYLTFMFMKNFLNLLDPTSIDPNHFTTHSSFSNYAPETRSVIHKKRARKSLFECLNLNLEDTEHPVDDFDFFDSDKKLAAHLQAEYLNNGELMYYLTNFEAALFFLSNVTGDELQLQNQAEILSTSIIKLVEKDMLTQFKFPEEVKQETSSSASSSPVRLRNNRSRSTSLLNAISSRLNAGSIITTRSRSNSGNNAGPARRETFPSMEVTEDDGSSLMRSLITRFSSVSVPQFRTPTSEGDADSIDARLETERANSVDEHADPKRNSITQKFSTGVTEFMTRIGQSQGQSQSQSFTTIANHASQTSLDLKAAEGARSRTTSIQIMDRWFGAISQTAPEAEHNDSTVESQEESSVFSAPIRELTKYQDTDFDSLTIQDLRTLKAYYDQLCTELGVSKSESKTTGDSHSLREGL